MEMTKNEIFTSWREAKDKKDQVKILADLNCTTQEHIVEILKESGADGRLLPHKRKPAEKKEPPQTVAANPDEPAQALVEVSRRPKPRAIHDMERMMDLFAAVACAVMQAEEPAEEYMEEFEELWSKYYLAKNGWSE